MITIRKLRERAPDPIAWLHPESAVRYGVLDGDEIDLETRNGKVLVRASVTNDIAPGVVSLAHGWEEDLNANNLNELEARDPITGYCEFRNLACSITKHSG